MTGCSLDGTMFSVMKQSMALKGFEFSTQITVETGDSSQQWIFSGEVDDELEGNMNVTVKTNDKSYELQDVLRIAGGGLYLNADALAQSVGLTSASDVNVKQWVKIADVKMGSTVKKDIAQVYEEFVDKLETVCQGMTITKEDGVYKLSVTDADSISFLKEVLSMLDANSSDWYKSYVAIKNETGLSQTAIDLLDVFWNEDIVQVLDGTSTDSFKTNYQTWSQNVRDDLSALEKNIKSGAANSIVEYSIGKNDDVYTEEMSIEKTDSDGAEYKLTIVNKRTQKTDISIEAPADEDVTNSVEGQQVARSLLTSLISNTAQVEADDNATPSLDTSGLTKEQSDAIASTLKNNQMYLMNVSDGLESIVLTYDNSNLNMENQVAEYYNSVTSSRGSGVECSLFYEKGSMSKDLKEKYKLYQYDSKDSNYKEDLKKVKTGAGKVSYFTCLNVSSDSNLTNVVFAIPIDDDCFIRGYLEYSGELDVEAFIDALFKKIEKVN
jgi:hypothetical protein